MCSRRACCACCWRASIRSSILCLTFTKAGAAEMAERIHARLAYWVRLKTRR
jgi:ATP-dependent exoDNAse (exonuclease V) beta subunit